MTSTFQPPAAWGLPPREVQVLGALLQSRETLTKDAALDALYGDADAPDHKIIYVFVCKMRPRLLRQDERFVIETVWGRGYRIAEEVKALILAHDAAPTETEQAA